MGVKGRVVKISAFCSSKSRHTQQPLSTAVTVKDHNPISDRPKHMICQKTWGTISYVPDCVSSLTECYLNSNSGILRVKILSHSHKLSAQKNIVKNSPQNTSNSGSESDTSSVMELNEKLLEAHKKVSQSPPSKMRNDDDD